MKYFWFFLLLLTFHFFLLSSQVAAQDFTYAKAYQDYLYNFDIYRTSHLEYATAKSEYQTYGTLTSQTKALEKTKKMLIARDETLRTFLTAVRMKLKEETSIIDYQQNLAYIKLDDQISFLKTHELVIPSASTIDDLNNNSVEFEFKYSESIFYTSQAKGVIFLGRVNVLNEEVNKEIVQIEEKINQMKESGKEVSDLERWLIQAKQKQSRSKEKYNLAINSLSQMNISRNTAESFSLFIRNLEEANQYSKETITNLKEIIKEIKRV